MKRKQGNKSYNMILDILRVAACAGVFATHIWQVYGVEGNGLFSILEKICGAGANGVVILFVLSGYLAWSGLDSEKFDRKKYWKKRALRLSPAYFMVLILYLLFGLMPINLGILRYFTYTNGVIPSYDFGLYNNKGGLWTMSCFAFFYLIAPLIKKHIDNLKGAVTALVAMFCLGKIFDLVLHPVLISLSTDEITYMEAIFPVGNMYLFLLGVVAYYAVKENKEFEVILAGIVMVSALLMINKIDYPLWGTVAAIIIILSANVQPKGNRMSFIGASIRQGSLISYEVYLSHYLFIELMKGVDLPFEPAIILTATIALSYLLHWCSKFMNRKMSTFYHK